MKRKRLFAGLGLLIAISIAALFLLRNYAKTGQAPLTDGYVDRLRGLVVDGIRLKNDSGVYALKNGQVFRNGEELSQSGNRSEYSKVLRVALFYRWSKEEPLMFSQNLDYAAFEKSLAGLDEAQKSLLKKMGREDGAIIYPINFLRSFATASRAYENFTAEISEQNAQVLLAEMEKASEDYHAEAENLRSSIAQAASGDLGKREMMSLGGETSTNAAVVLADMDKLVANAEVVAVDLAQRKACLEDSAVKCGKPLDVQNSVSSPDISKQEPVLLPAELTGADAVAERSRLYSITSACWGEPAKHYIYAGKKCYPELGICTARPVLADNSYFVSLGASEFERELARQGVVAKPLSPTTAYSCMDATYRATLETLDFFYRKYDTERFFTAENKRKLKIASSVVEEEFEFGRKAEESFFDARYPSGESMEKLGQAYAHAYVYFSREGVLDGAELDELLRRSVLLKERLNNFQLVLNQDIHHLKNYTDRSSAEKAKGLMLYNFISRSDYSIMFLNFSPYVWRSGNRLQYFSSKGGSVDEAGAIFRRGVINYRQALKDYGQENLLQWAQKVQQHNLPEE